MTRTFDSAVSQICLNMRNRFAVGTYFNSMDWGTSVYTDGIQPSIPCYPPLLPSSFSNLSIVLCNPQQNFVQDTKSRSSFRGKPKTRIPL